MLSKLAALGICKPSIAGRSWESNRLAVIRMVVVESVQLIAVIVSGVDFQCLLIVIRLRC